MLIMSLRVIDISAIRNVLLVFEQYFIKKKFLIYYSNIRYDRFQVEVLAINIHISIIIHLKSMPIALLSLTIQ